MIKYLLLSWWILSLTVRAEEDVAVRAYYIGKHVPKHWFSSPGDRFSGSWRSSIAPLMKAPFESPFFEKGDVLWDLGLNLNHAKVVSRMNHFIYNQTSGRMVVHSNGLFHHRSLAQFTFAEAEKLPRMIKLSLKVLEVPQTSNAFTHRSAKDLPSEGQLLAELSLLSRPGQKVTTHMTSPEMKLAWTPNWSLGDAVIECSLDVSGASKAKMFKLSTGLVSFDTVPQLFELGSVEGSGGSLLIWMEQEILLVGDVQEENLILPAEGRQRSRISQTPLFDGGGEIILDAKTGKMFREFRLPLAVLDYLDDLGADDSSEDDPFAEGEENAEEVSKSREYLKKWSSKVKSKPFDRVVNLQELLARQGVKFTENDFAVYNMETHLLTAEVWPTNMELIEIIALSANYEPPHLRACKMALFETDREVTLAGLTRKDAKCLAKASALGLAGREMKVALGNDEHTLRVSLEPNVGANDRMIDLGGHVSFAKGDSPLFDWSSGISLWAGTPQIVQSHRHGDKWWTLLMEVEMQAPGSE